MHCIKTKGIWDEVAKNPFTNYQHQFLTAYEQALPYVLASLDGHYAFMIALRTDEDNLFKRQETFAQLEKMKKRHAARVEKEMLFKMTEEEYLTFDEEKRDDVDAKREEYRRKILKIGPFDSQDSSALRKRRSSHSSKEKDNRRIQPKDDDVDVERGKDKKKETKKKSKDPERAENDRNKIKQPKAAPDDPIQSSVISFSLTIGSIAERIKDSGDLIAAINPYDITKSSASPSAVASQLSLPMERLPETPSRGAKNNHPTEIVIEPSVANFNSVIVDTSRSFDDVNLYVLSFVPTLNQIKEKTFTRFIPPPRIILPDPSTYQKGKHLQMPKYFSIKVDEPLSVDDVNSSHSIRPGSTVKSGRKSKARRDRSAEPLFSDDVDLSKRTPRWRIEANSSQTISIRFEALNIGSYKDNLTFSLLNGKSDIVKLCFSGICAYPDITRNFKLLFPKRVNRIDLKTEMSYVLDEGEFYFGSLLVAKEKSGKNQNAEYKQTIAIKNPSLFPAELTALLIHHR